MDFLFFLALGLFVLALVGHGLWLLGAAVIRGISGLSGSERRAAIRGEICPRCGFSWPLYPRRQSCSTCGWQVGDGQTFGRTSKAQAYQVLEQLQVRIRRYADHGLIPRDVARQLLDAFPMPPALEKDPVPDWFRPATPSEKSIEPEILGGEDLLLISGEEPVSRAPAKAEPTPPLARHGYDPVAPPSAPPRPWPSPTSVPKPEPIPTTPRRSWLDVLSAFQEESNIRWGELIGGLLIVGCSLALVISFWSRIAERPILKFGLFNGVTAAIYLLGLHASRRWSLPNTSKGLLVIAGLLTPLNFLAVAAFGKESSGAWWMYGGEALAIGLFAWLILQAGSILVASSPVALLIGVLTPSASLLVIGRLLGVAGNWWQLVAIGSVPLLAQAVGQFGWLRRNREPEVLEASRARELLHLLGQGGFAAATAVGLILWQGGLAGFTFRDLAPLSPLAGLALLMPGVTLWTRSRATERITDRVIGAAVSTGGILLLLAGLVLAWPSVGPLLLVSVLNVILLTTLGFALSLPVAHAFAGLCLAVTYLLIWSLCLGRLDWSGNADLLTAAILGNLNATVMLPFGILYGAGAYVLLGRGRPMVARPLALVAGLCGLDSVAILTWNVMNHGTATAGATWIYLAQTVTCLGFAWAFGHRPIVGRSGIGLVRCLGWLACLLGVATTVLGLGDDRWSVWVWYPVLFALILNAGLSAVVGGLLPRMPRWSGDPILATLSGIFSRWAVGVACLASLIVLLATPTGPPRSLVLHATVLSGIWASLAYRFDSHRVFAVFQGMLTLSAALGIHAILAAQGWYVASPVPHLDPRTWQAFGTGLAALSAGWIGVRLASRRYRERSASIANWSRLLDPPLGSVDQWLRDGIVVVTFLLAFVAVVPGVAQELAPLGVAGGVPGSRVVPPISSFELAGIPHALAYGWGTWTLWGMTLAVLVLTGWERARRENLLKAMVVLALVAPLVAAPFEAQVAAASALRWAGSLTILGLSALIWSRRRLAEFAGRMGWGWEAADFERLPALATALVILLGVGPTLLMVGYLAANSGGGGLVLSGHPTLGLVLAISGCLVAVGGMQWLAGGTLEPGRWPILRSTGSLVGTMGLIPFAILGLFAMASTLASHPLVGPDPASPFGRMGAVASSVAPLLILGVTLLGYAIRERSSGFAASALGLANVAATWSVLFLATRRGQGLDGSLCVRLAEINAMILAAGGLVWILAVGQSRLMTGWPATGWEDERLRRLVSIAVTALGLMTLAGALGLLVDPIGPDWVRDAGDPLGLVAYGLTALAFYGISRSRGVEICVAPIAAGGTALAAVLGFTAAWLGRTYWENLRLVVDFEAIAAVVPGLFYWQRQSSRGEPMGLADRKRIGVWSLVSLGVIVAFSLRLFVIDPKSPLWTLAGLTFSGLLAVALVVWMEQTRHFVISAACVLGAGTFWWISTSAWSSATGTLSALGDLVRANVAALAIACPLWCWVERRFLRPPGTVRIPRNRGLLPFHEQASRLALLGLALTVGIGLARDAMIDASTPTEWLGWLAFLATALAVSVGFWDPETRRADFRLYLLGLATVGWLVHVFHLDPRHLLWTGTIVLAAYGVATSYLWSKRRSIREVAAGLGVPVTPDEDATHPRWLIPMNTLLALVVYGLSFGFILTDASLAMRQLAAQATLSQCLTFGLLAVGERRSRLQRGTLIAGVVGLVAIGWALIEPRDPNGLLDRVAAVVAASVAAGSLYGLGLSKWLKRENDWTVAGERVVPGLMVMEVVSIGLVLGLELLARFNGDPVAISASAAIVVAVAIGWWVLSSLLAALVPGRDLFKLSEQGRTIYVYGAEVMLVVLMVHLKVSMPYLFSGALAKYWVLIVMGLAFLGVGLGELFRRQGRMVLAIPLERTGAFLPLLPMVAAYWMSPRPGEDVVFLVLVGGLYSLMSVMRGSLMLGSLATLAFNGALWALLSHSPGLAFAQHPQIWMIPPAICLVVGGYLNRDLLSEGQLATIRYIAALMVYVSSTTELVLNGVGQAPWLPLVLAGLAIAGMFAGILLRVRGFLFLGFGFLGLAVFSVIWHAAVNLDQTWLWWASGIVTGILILAMFAVFEKRREDILRLVEELKDWSV